MIPSELIEQIRAHSSLTDLISQYVELRQRGRGHVGLCPFHGEKTPSFTVYPDQRFHCFGCGADGDVISFLMRIRSLSFRDAVMRLVADAGLARDRSTTKPLASKVSRPTVEQLEAEKARSVEMARACWREARSAVGTVIEAYLRSRGITIAPPPSLRFHPRLAYYEPDPRKPKRFRLAGHWPAMIGGVQGPDGKITGVHRTYLRPDGLAKADLPNEKKMAGVCWGGAVRFAKAGPTLILAEGIETGLSMVEALPELPTWAALSLGNVAGAGKGRGKPHPRSPDKVLPDEKPDMDRPGIILPDVVSEVILAADSDNGDPESAEALLQRAVRRFTAQGRIVRVARAPDGFDFNDVLQWPDNIVPLRRTAA